MPLNESVPQISLSELLRKLSELRRLRPSHHDRIGAAGSCRRTSESARGLPLAHVGRHQATGLLSPD